MGKFVCLLVCLAVAVHSGYALRCYMCDSDKVDGCIKSAGPKDKPCGNANPGNQQVCYYKVAFDKSKNMNMVNATCQEIPSAAALDQSSIPSCASPGAGIEIKECRVCNKDLCNSAPTFSSSLVALVCLPAMYLFSKMVF